MISNRFSLYLLLRMIFILCLMFSIAMTRLETQWFFVNVILAPILLFAILELFWFIKKTNNDLNKFLDGLKNEDLSLHFSSYKSGYLFADMHQSFNDVTELYRQSKLEKEAHKEFLKIAVDRLRIGVIAVDDQNNILIFNEFARQCLSERAPTDWQILRMRKIPFVLKMEEMKSGETEVFNFKTEQGTLSLAIRAHRFVILEQSIRLFTFQDIRDELDRQELASWHKVIRILTHEIMNSLTPVISLTETAGMLLNEPDAVNNHLPDIKSSISTAESRAKGLLNFVRSYRQFLKVPQPKISAIEVLPFVHNIQQLFTTSFQEKNINFQLDTTKAPTTFQGDQYLLEQVFINLLKNAIDAVATINSPTIQFIIEQQSKKTIFKIQDNGSGIPSELIDKVMVPFFTTKENGTGVGLSLSRQIIVGHGGRMTIDQPENGGTTFVIEL